MRGLDVGENQYQIVVAIPNKANKALISVGRDNHGLPRMSHDLLPQEEHRTIIRSAKTQSRAVAMASKFGRVLSCQKIDPYYSLYKIEHLNLNETIEIVPETYEFGENGEITKR